MARSKTSSRAVTLVDVGKKAGVSAITVSRAINQPDKVSPVLRSQIQQAIDELGYIPNQFASSLASQRSRVLGVVIPSLSNVVFNDVLKGIYEVAARVGLKVVLVDTNYSADEEEKLIHTLLSLAPEAMIITGGEQTDRCRHLLKRAKIPIVQLMELLSDPIDMNVGFSHQQASRDVVTALLEQGYRRIGFMGARMDARVMQRMQGYIDAMQHTGLPWESYVITTEAASSVALGGQLLQQLLLQLSGEAQPLEAIFCCNDDLAWGALFEAQRMGLAIPDQLALCGFNDFEASQFINPALSSVHVPRYQMGVAAAEMVVAALEKTPVPQKVIDVGYSVLLRESSRR